jgi:hypothetical protein
MPFFTPGTPAREIEVLASDRSLHLGLQLTADPKFQIENLDLADRLDFYRSGETRPAPAILRGSLYLLDTEKQINVVAPVLEFQGMSDFRIMKLYPELHNSQVVGLHALATGTVVNLKVDGKPVLPGVIERRIGTDRALVLLGLLFTAVGLCLSLVTSWEMILIRLNLREKSDK